MQFWIGKYETGLPFIVKQEEDKIKKYILENMVCRGLGWESVHPQAIFAISYFATFYIFCQPGEMLKV